MSGSSGPLDFLKKISSKMDKLFLGDMIKSNNSNLKSLSKDYDYYSSYSSQSSSENLYQGGYDFNNKNNKNNKNNVKSNNEINNEINNINNSKNNNSSNFSEEYSKIIQNDSYLDDKYSKYIHLDEFDEVDYRNSYQNKQDENNWYGVDGGKNYVPNKNLDYWDNSLYNEYTSLDDSTQYTQYGSRESYTTKDDKNKSKINEFLKLFNLNNLKNMLLNSGDSSKNRLGLIAFVLIILVLGCSIFYFGFYQPFQNELNTEKTAKLNELNTLYKGPLEVNDHYYYLKNMIEDSNDIEEVKSIDVLRTATKDWQDYHIIKINAFEDSYGRIMMSYSENGSKKVIMPSNDAKLFVNENDAKILSNVIFEKVDTVIIPVSITRLQATGGLISVGSIVDIYTLNSENSVSINSEESNSSSDSSNLSNGVNGNSPTSDSYSNEEPNVSGATVLAILRSKDSGVIDSSFTSSTNKVKGNLTYPTEKSSSFSTDVEELLKSSVFDGNTNNALDSYLNSYGIKLSNYERLSNIGELDTEYLVLLEVPRSDVNFVINNMENLILTIPTEYAPNWAINELNETYYEELNYNGGLF